jgi:hypothetical protein
MPWSMQSAKPRSRQSLTMYSDTKMIAQTLRISILFPNSMSKPTAWPASSAKPILVVVPIFLASHTTLPNCICLDRPLPDNTVQPFSTIKQPQFWRPTCKRSIPGTKRYLRLLIGEHSGELTTECSLDKSNSANSASTNFLPHQLCPDGILRPRVLVLNAPPGRRNH